MTGPVTGRTRGGSEWVPAFVVALDQERCIGCGRCLKVCPRDVYDLVDRAGDDDDEKAKVMAIRDPLDCIGCGACARVCPKKCHTHEPQAAA